MEEFKEVQVKEVKHYDTDKSCRIITVRVKQEVIDKYIEENDLEQLHNNLIEQLSSEIREKVK